MFGFSNRNHRESALSSADEGRREKVSFDGSMDFGRLHDEIRWREISGLVINLRDRTIEYPAELREDIRELLKAA